MAGTFEHCHGDARSTSRTLSKSLDSGISARRQAEDYAHWEEANNPRTNYSVILAENRDLR